MTSGGLEELEVKCDLFKDVKYYVAGCIRNHVEKLLVDGGARRSMYLADMVTMVISDDAHNCEVEEARDVFDIPTVTSRWIVLSAKCGVQLPTNGFKTDGNQLFSEVVACPTGLSGEDARSVWAMVTYYGGQFQLALDRNCTHLIAGAPEGKKYSVAMSRSFKIVTPDWVVESIKKRVRLDETAFHPRLLDLPTVESPVTAEDVESTASLFGELTTVVPSASPESPRTNSASIPVPKEEPALEFCKVSEANRVPQMMAGRILPTSVPRSLSSTVTTAQGVLNVTWSKDCILSAGQAMGRNVVPMGRGMPIRANQPQIQLQPNQQQDPPQQQSLQKFVVSAWEAQQLQLQRQQKMQELMQQQQLKQLQNQHGANVGTWQRTPNSPTSEVAMNRTRTPMHPQAQMVQQRATTPQQFQQQQRAWLMTQGREGAPQLGQPQPPLQMQPQHPQWLQQQSVRENQNQLVGQPQTSLPNTWPQQQVQAQASQGLVTKTVPQTAAVQRKSCSLSNQVHWQQQQQPPPQHQLVQQVQHQKLVVQELRENAAPVQQQVQWQQPVQQQHQPQSVQARITQQQLPPRLECPQPPQQAMTRDNVLLLQQQSQQTMAKMQQSNAMTTALSVQQQQRTMAVSRVNAPPMTNFQVSTGVPRVSSGNHPTVTGQQVSLSVVPVNTALTQAQQPLPHDRLHHVVQQGQQQIQLQLQSVQAQAQLTQPNALTGQPQQVTPKTKTALANLVNSRIQSTPRVSDYMEITGQLALATVPSATSPICSTASAISPRSASSEAAIYQSTLRNITNNNNPQVSPVKMVPSKPEPGQVVMRTVTAAVGQAPVPFVQYYGHEPALKVPPEMCLAGCVIFITDYDRMIPADELDKWCKVIERHHGEVESRYGPLCTHVLCDNLRNSVVQQAMREGKRCVTAHWLNDVLLQKKLRAPWTALHLPTPFADDKPCKGQKIAVSLFEGDERAQLKAMITQAGAEYTGYMSKKNSILICRKAEGIKFDKAREWDISVVNVQWLHDILFGHLEAMRLPLAHKYQQFAMDNPFVVDYALVPHLMTAWKVPIQITESAWQKAMANPGSMGQIKENQRSEDSNCNTPKRQRLSPELEENVPLTTNFPPADGNRPLVMFTGVNDSKALARNVLQLGGALTTSARQCTHLVTDALSRTVKFLCAISNCKYVLTRGWIIDSCKQNRFTDEKAYILSDHKNEKHFGCNVKQTLFRSSRTPVFSGLAFYVTPGVRPCQSVMREIIECAGGTVCKKKPSKSELLVANANGTKIVVIGCDGDLYLCQSWAQNKIPIHNAEFVLTGVMKQEVDFQSYLIPVVPS